MGLIRPGEIGFLSRLLTAEDTPAFSTRLLQGEAAQGCPGVLFNTGFVFHALLPPHITPTIGRDNFFEFFVVLWLMNVFIPELGGFDQHIDLDGFQNGADRVGDAFL